MRKSRKKVGGGSGKGIKLDPNLTYPIVLNASIYATLDQAPSNLVKDWFMPLLSIVVVIIGAFATYLTTITIEREKNLYDLKKSVFFDIMKTIITARDLQIRLNDLAKRTQEFDTKINRLGIQIQTNKDLLKEAKEAKDDKKLLDTRTNQVQTKHDALARDLEEAEDNVKSRKQEAIRLKQELEEHQGLLRLQQMNLAICANDKTIHVFKQVIAKKFNEKDYFEAVFKELIPALRDDLIKAKPKSWWQFWTRGNR